MIDLHAHVLPGVDDGAESLAEAVEMCRLAASGGCELVVATPHQRHPSWWNSDSALLRALLEELRDAVGPEPELALGGEIHVDSALLDAVGQADESGLLPLAGSRYLLLELSRGEHATDPLDLLHEVQLAGWRPILAHPEFIPSLVEDAGLVPQLVEAGGLMQVTAGSLTGRFGRPAQRLSRDLVDRGLVHFVASDAHSPSWRPPDLAEAYAMITAGWGGETARRLCRENPRAVVEDRAIPTTA